jgi:hypothetical protein
MDSKVMESAYRAGVTTLITKPLGTNLINGYSTAFFSKGNFVSDSNVLINKTISLNINLGNKSKRAGTSTSSISSQISTIRNFFKTTTEKIDSVTAHVNNADVIDRLIEIQNEFKFKLIISGASEVHLLVDKIKNNKNITIIFIPKNSMESSDWETRRADDDECVKKLVENNINFGIGSGKLFI